MTTTLLVLSSMRVSRQIHAVRFTTNGEFGLGHACLTAIHASASAAV